jgi:hypothetical protein
MRSVRLTQHATVQYVEPQEDHFFSRQYLRNRSTLDKVFWVILVHFNLRNTLPKSGTFLPGHPVYICLVFHATEEDNAAWVCECYCSFHFVVEVKVSCIFVERNTFPYAYYFIRTYCLLHIYVTTAVGNGRYLPKLLSSRVHGVAQGTGKLFRFPRNPVRYVH